MKILALVLGSAFVSLFIYVLVWLNFWQEGRMVTRERSHASWDADK